MARLYKVDGTTVDVEPKNGKDFSCEELQAFVGGFFEVVPVLGSKYLIVNENGRMMNLARNERMSALMFGEIIGDVVGDALLCDRCEIL